MILTRFKKTKTTILGILKDDVGGTYFTCENAAKAIPNGDYIVALTTSPKFGCKLPLLVGKYVEAVRGIRIHAGKSYKNSEGCILIGNSCDLVSCTIDDCQRALDQLIRTGGVSLTITGGI